MEGKRFKKKTNPKVKIVVDKVENGDIFYHEVGYSNPRQINAIEFWNKFEEDRKPLTEFAQRNLDVINNFILFYTHCNENEHAEMNNVTSQGMYQAARDYIEEDHVDGMDRDEAPADGYRILTAKSAAELQRKVAQLMDEGWVTDGPHQVVCIESYDQYAGNQHRAVKYEYEYSQTMTH